MSLTRTSSIVSNITSSPIESSSTLYPEYKCRAWVNFDGTKDTTGASSTSNTNRLIRGSGNVLNVLRNGAGDYTITFITNMPDANYTYVFGANSGASTGTDGRVIAININVPPTSSALRIWAGLPGSISMGFGGNLGDLSYISVAIFR